MSVGELTKPEEEAEDKSKKKRESGTVYFTHMGAAPVESITTKFGNALHLTDVQNLVLVGTVVSALERCKVCPLA